VGAYLQKVNKEDMLTQLLAKEKVRGNTYAN